MINTNNMNKLIENNNLAIYTNKLPVCEIEEYDLLDEKDFKKYIEDIERLVRGSIEYKIFIKFLREVLQMNTCSFYENVNNIDTHNISIEQHHSPLSLYDITVVIYTKRNKLGEPLNVELVAKEVVYLHYLGFVGLIPVSKTVHELIHNSYLFVPTNKIFGLYKTFMNLYDQYIPDEMKDILEDIEVYSRRATYLEQNKKILETKLMYVDTSGQYNLSDYKYLVESMNERITYLEENNSIGQFGNSMNSNVLIEPIQFII